MLGLQTWVTNLPDTSSVVVFETGSHCPETGLQSYATMPSLAWGSGSFCQPPKSTGYRCECEICETISCVDSLVYLASIYWAPLTQYIKFWILWLQQAIRKNLEFLQALVLQQKGNWEINCRHLRQMHLWHTEWRYLESREQASLSQTLHPQPAVELPPYQLKIVDA